MRTIDKKDFELIKRVASNISNSKKMADNKKNNSELPSVIGIKLTNRCNLRCKHCYEWNENGYHHNLSDIYKNADIDISLVKKCINETESVNSMVYLWGGEPLLYNNIDELLELLYINNRYTIICTNGTLLKNHYNKILAFDDKIELLLAIDGDKTSHDALRGKGNFDLIIEQIKPLIQKKEQNLFNGTISVHTMVSNENIISLYDTVCFLDSLGIDNLILCLPWYISDETSKEMDEYFNLHFSKFNLMPTSIHSWHAYKYRIYDKNFELVNSTLKRIRNSNFRMNIKFQPDIKDEELICFLEGKSINNCDNRECYTIFSRMDVLPNGLVTSCKHFHELSYADLKTDSIKNLWMSKELDYIRNTICEKQMPVCSKCNNLYNHSYKKR